MRIVLVNWAPIKDGTAKGGGVNGYCQALASEFVRSGHDVISLYGGLTYEPAPGNRCEPGACHVRRGPDWQGVRTFEVVNSPVLAPSIHQFNEPMGEVSAPELERVLADLSADLRPDIVHFHNLEGFSIGCVAALRGGRAALDRGPARADARVFVSLHNYHTVCPQVNLLRGHRIPCFDFDNGHACVHCVEAPDPAAARRRLMEGGGAFSPMFLAIPLWMRKALWRIPGLRRWARAVKRRLHERRRIVPVETVSSDGNRLTWVPLTNAIEPEPRSSRPPNEYARRRSAMIQMLNSCDSVLAVSEFVRRKYESMGVDGDVISTLHIGTRINELARQTPRRDPPPMHAPNGAGGGPRPIRLIFLGFNHYSKGLPMLADSLALLVPEVLARLHVSVYALGAGAIEERFRRLQKSLGGLTFCPGYRFEEVPRLVSQQDLGIVPSVWWDNGPQTVFEFLGCGVPVLAADVGGIPDFVRDGVNGLLFRANDRYDLARRLAQVARNPGILEELRRNVRPPKDMATHAQELVRLYQRAILSESREDPACPQTPRVHVRQPASSGVGEPGGVP